ncbi:MAG: L,D-transpeptidase [Hyphomicrobium sp.]|nr:MAG: L,D-transpeptidase [Hyphomicrobium sp.]PPD00625.1 MAG: L,D-transpeptidase [Hyphomicrobium sp.]
MRFNDDSHAYSTRPQAMTTGKLLSVASATLLLFVMQAHAQTTTQPNTEPAVVSTPQAQSLASELREAAAQLPANASEHERADRDARVAFYEKRGTPLWVTPTGISEGAHTLARELANARDYGLGPKSFELPELATAVISNPRLLAELDVKITRTAMTYARHARGGRIAEPAEMLNSNLDRKPQLIAPNEVLETLASATDPAEALRGFHPKHPQFEKLRQAYLAELPKDGKAGALNATAKRLRTNMEMWRWMWDDLGAVHVFNNIPEFMQTVYKDGAPIHSERIVVGMLDKQSSVYSRPLKHVVLRPKWRVPESIMVHELWPSLLRGGGLMRQYGLEIQTKSGEPRDWRRIDWSKDDIRNYIVTQAPGPRSVLGYVKFSFPSQHTIFMHDTPDKWMFKSAQRTLSHGCLRVRNPMRLAELMLAEGKGWDAAKVAQMAKSGPLNNEIEMDKKIPIHLAYFTAWVDDGGKVKFFRDIYGHEKRVTQALDGAWDKINKGRNHLAPPQPNFNPAAVAAKRPTQQQSRQKDATVGDMIGNALGLTF